MQHQTEAKSFFRSQTHMGVFATVGVAILYWVLLQKPYYQYLNYTFAISTALLHGHLGLTYSRPWLDELIPAANGLYYSVFPLGAVLSVLPLGALTYFGILGHYPVNAMVVLAAASG